MTPYIKNFSDKWLVSISDESNPQEGSDLKKTRIQENGSQSDNYYEQLPTFKKIMNQNSFAQDDFLSNKDESNLFQQKQGKKLSFSSTKLKKQQKIDLIESKLKNQNQKAACEMTFLLRNCKMSILSLQSEVDQKNKLILKLQEQNRQLSSKLSTSQKQVERNQQMLQVYMREQKTNTQKSQSLIGLKQEIPMKSIVNQQLLNYQQKINNLLQECQNHKQLNQNQIMENHFLKTQNYHLKDQIFRISSQNLSLKQKINTMGKGVGKALSTIKKNNNHAFLDHILSKSDEKQNKTERACGKIVFKNLQTLSDKKIRFETPLKNISNSTDSSQKQSKLIAFSTQRYEQKLSEISIHAQRIDQFEKLQNMLAKMNSLAVESNQSDAQ